MSLHEFDYATCAPLDRRAGYWTEEKVELLKQLWAEGVSGGLIAQKLGGITRDAVIGKAWRMGLQSRKPSTWKSRHANVTRNPPKPKNKRIVRWGPIGHRILDIENIEPLASKLDPAAVPAEQRKTFMELADCDCRFPYGEPGNADFFFCGAQTFGLSYCPAHMRVAYEPPRARIEHWGKRI